MPKAVWSGTLTFGLVTIPVRLFPATEPKDIRFHLVDERGRRVRYRRFVESEPPPPMDVETVTPAAERTAKPEEGAAPPPEEAIDGGAEPETEEEVDYGHLMRGFETDDGRIVMMRRDEIEAARPERSHTIEIEDFVRLSDIDPVYFEKSYVVAPQRGAERPYVLLLHAIERSGRAGIGRFVLRTKPHLVAIRPRDGVLGLETLFFGDEVRNGRTLAPGTEGVEVAERELALAQTLIETLKTEWDPAAYADTYRDELLRRIAEKTPLEREVETVTEPAASRRAAELMEALKASVESARKAKKKPSRKRPA